jgi:hypothetical protein
MDPRAGLDDVEKRKFLTVPGLELRPFSRPARSQSLYRLHPGASTPKNRWDRRLSGAQGRCGHADQPRARISRHISVRVGAPRTNPRERQTIWARSHVGGTHGLSDH